MCINQLKLEQYLSLKAYYGFTTPTHKVRHLSHDLVTSSHPSDALKAGTCD